MIVYKEKEEEGEKEETRYLLCDPWLLYAI